MVHRYDDDGRLRRLFPDEHRRALAGWDAHDVVRDRAVGLYVVMDCDGDVGVNDNI